jgi:AcrR family transcriptional regulator
MTAVTRPKNRRGEGERLRDDLLDATVDLIAETGSIDEVSLRAAAKRAGVSPTAVYRHFEDRDALVEAAVIRCWERFRGALAVALETEDPFARLRQAGEIYARFAIEQPRAYAVMMQQTDGLDRATPVGLSAFDDLVSMIAAILEANGDHRDPTYVATLVHTWMHGIVTLVVCTDQIPWPSTDQLLTELLTRLELVPR